MKRSLSFAVRVVGLAAMSIAFGLLGPVGRAATLYWTGSVSTNWFDTDGGNTNWRNALNEQVLPTDGDDLVFTSAGTYTGNLTLGGATITLNSLTVGDPTDRSLGGLSDFGVDMRVLATNGTIRFSGAGGLNVEFPDGVSTNNSNDPAWNPQAEWDEQLPGRERYLGASFDHRRTVGRRHEKRLRTQDGRGHDGNI